MSEANIMSSTAFCGRILSAPQKKIKKVERKCKTDRDLYDVEVFEVDRTRKQIKFISWDSVTNTMSGVITIIKGITFPSFAWEKMFFPEEGWLEDRGNIHGQFYRCLIPSISSQLCVQEQIPWTLLRPLKWYKLESCGNK